MWSSSHPHNSTTSSSTDAKDKGSEGSYAPSAKDKVEDICSECREVKPRSMAMAQCYAYAGVPIGGGTGFLPISWQMFNAPGGRRFKKTFAWANWKQRYPDATDYGYFSSGGAEVTEHPFGHPDRPDQAWHKCPHFHAIRFLGDPGMICTYAPGPQ